MLRGEYGWQIAVFSHRGWHARTGENGGIQEGNVAEHGTNRHEQAQPSAANEFRCGREIGGIPVPPIPERCQRKKSGQKIHCDRKRNNDRERERIAALGLVDLFGDA